MEKSLSYQARREVLQQIAPQYREASSSQKRMLLDAFVATTGYHRTYARWLLNHAEEGEQTHGRSQLRKYGPEVQHALFLAWNAANRICAKRLMPFLPTLIEALVRHEHLHLTEECRSQLLSMSAATADRLLRSQRTLGLRGLSTTRAGTLLKQQIPIRTFQEWKESRLQILGIDTDSGGEFINEAVIAYCEQAHISFTRGRPYVKNDQCFVEQKNGSIVRQVVGYDRLVGEHAYRQLTELYRALRLYVNCFQPSMKLLSKQHEGKKVRCVYDPAKTPLQRLLLSGVLPVQQQQELTEIAQALDLVRLLHQLELVQQAVFRCAVGCSPFVSSPLSDPLHVFSVEQCTAGRLPLHQQDSRPCTESRSEENACWDGGAPTKTPLRENGSRSSPGWWPILNGAAATSFGSCSAAPQGGINRYKSVPYNEG